MSKLEQYNKAIMVVIGGLATIGSVYTNTEVPPEVVTSVGFLITTLLTYWVPNLKVKK